MMLFVSIILLAIIRSDAGIHVGNLILVVILRMRTLPFLVYIEAACRSGCGGHPASHLLLLLTSTVHY